jgi:hypothetical protein
MSDYSQEEADFEYYYATYLEERDVFSSFEEFLITEGKQLCEECYDVVSPETVDKGLCCKCRDAGT